LYPIQHHIAPPKRAYDIAYKTMGIFRPEIYVYIHICIYNFV